MSAALAFAVAAAEGRERLVEVRLERPRALQIVVAGASVTRIDWICGDAPPPSPPQAPCASGTARTRSWGLADAERAELERTLAATGLFAGDGEGAAGAGAGDAVITAILQDAGHARVVRRVSRGDAGSADAFATAAGALTALAPPPAVEAPAVYRGVLPQRAEVELVLEGAARYRLTLRIVPLHGRPAGGAGEAGQWAFDPDTSTIRMTPSGASATRRSAVLTGGRRAHVLLDLDGYFPVGTRVELTPAPE